MNHHMSLRIVKGIALFSELLSFTSPILFMFLYFYSKGDKFFLKLSGFFMFTLIINAFIVTNRYRSSFRDVRTINVNLG